MKKILIVATVQSHVAQFHNRTIKALKEQGYIVHVAAKDNLKEKDTLKIEQADKIFDFPFARSPLSFTNIKAYKMLKKLLKENGYDVIYCHTPVGGALSRLAGKKYRKKGLKIIYMAHGFHFFKGASKKNWLIYYTIEKALAKYTDCLITINKEDFELAKRKLKAKRIEHVNGVGVDFDRLICTENREDIRKELGYTDEDFVILSVGELNQNKNNITVLKAISQIQDKKVKYMMAGNGPLKSYLTEQIQSLGLTDRVQFLGYTRNIGRYFKAADVMCFMSYREGLGLAALEGMNFGLPILTSNRHGINDYSINGETGYKCNPADFNALKENILKIKNDKENAFKMGENNKEVCKKYAQDIVQEKITEIIIG